MPTTFSIWILTRLRPSRSNLMLNPRPKIIWREAQRESIPNDLLDFCGSEFLAGCLVHREITTRRQAQLFLDPSRYSPADPADLPDLEKGAARIWKAVQSNETIGVWGDFDVDGQTSTTLLVSVLHQLGAHVLYHIPVRSTESHGVNLPGLKEFLDKGVQVLLTCDTGVTAFDTAAYAKNHGIDMVITDHHKLAGTIPRAYAVVNPQRLPAGHALRTIPGVGTAYCFAQEICRLAGRYGLAEEHLDLVALGTVADVATLTQDARFHVQKGLEILRQNQRIGLQQLYTVADINTDQITEEQIGFMIAPRLNALGRLSDANPIVNFFTTIDTQQAAVFAAQLEGLNAERKFLTDQIFKGAIAQIQSDPGLLDHPALILSHPEWHAGVVGIVASRLVELYNRPTILLVAPPDHPMHGSARSVEGLDITAAISKAANSLLGYGGHPMAAGLSLLPENLNIARRKIWADLSLQAAETTLENSILIEATLNFADINFEFAEQIEKLSPFGAGNPAPLLATRNIRVIETQKVGKQNEHLVVLLEDEQHQTRRVIWWNGDEDLLPNGQFDLAYTLRARNYRGQTDLQLEWKSAREMNTDSIGNLSFPSTVNILDLRMVQDPLLTLQKEFSHRNIALWAEGLATRSIPQARNRNQLIPAEILVIFTPPPDRASIQAAIKAVNPQKIVLLNLDSSEDTPEQFLKQLTGLVRFALLNHAGKLIPDQLAGVLGQTTHSIHLGIEWLCERGNIRILEQNPEFILVAEGGVPNSSRISGTFTSLKDSLEETTAFRRFYNRAQPQQIITASDAIKRDEQ